MKKLISLLAILLVATPAFASSKQTVNIGTQVTGTLAVGNGGTGFYNFKTALNATLNGSTNTRVCYLGDSTTFGVGSTGSVATGQNFPPLSYPGQISSLMAQNYGVAGTFDSFFGAGYNAQTFGNSDSRITQGSSWTQDTAVTSLGNYTFTASTNTNALSFTPVSAVDTFRIFYVQDTTQGVLQADIGGAGSQTFNTSGTQGVGVVTMTAGSVAVQALNMRWSSGGKVNVIGVEAYNSTQPTVIAELAGVPAGTGVQAAINSVSYNSGRSAIYSAIGCNLTVIQYGINDWDAATSVGTFKTAIQTLVTAVLSSGSDVLLLSPVPTNTSYATTALQQSYVNALAQLGQSNAVPFVDIHTAWTSYAYSQPLLMYADTFTHPNYKGYKQEAKLISSSFLDAPTKGKNDYQLSSHFYLDNSSNVQILGPSYQNGVGNFVVASSNALTLQNTANSDRTAISYLASGSTWYTGVGNSSESTLGVANKYYIYNGSLQMSISSTGVGIKTNNALSALDVNGGAAVGNGYAGTTAAPSNGAIIQGNVGIGTTNPLATLHVAGTIKTQGYTVATLPTGSVGMRAYVTDQTTSCPAAGGALTGGGTITCPVFYNATAWVGD